MKLKSYLPGFFVLMILAIYHNLAMINEWYFYYSYTDTIMHFLGGFFLAYTTWWVYMRLNGKGHIGPPSVILSFMIIITTTVALGWEYFEWTNDLVYPSSGGAYATDTVKDICMALWGAITASILLTLFGSSGFLIKEKRKRNVKRK